MNKGRLFLSLVLAFALVSTAAHARNQRCGIGTMLFGHSKGIVSQTVENTSNRVLYGYYSISSGTSGCKHNGYLLIKGPGSFGQVTRDQELYVDANYEELMLEMARGKGEILQAFAESLGCEKGVWGEFYKTTQTNYSKIFTPETNSPDVMLNNVKKEIQANPRLSVGCRTEVI